MSISKPARPKPVVARIPDPVVCAACGTELCAQGLDRCDDWRTAPLVARSQLDEARR